jgi:hypothetical protein
MFTFGLDPEFMVTLRDELKSAIGVLPKKDNAKDKNGTRLYYDNVLAEVAVKPARNRDEALANVRDGLTLLAHAIVPAKFVVRASDTFPKSELKGDDALIAGCNPEWSVYNLQVIEPPEDVVDFKDGYYWFKVPFRSCGGHIHIGSEELADPQYLFNVVRMMDLFVAVPSLFMDTDPSSKARRRAYGMAGSHRCPDYGVEYRPLGNFWLSSPAHVALMYDLTEFVLKFVAKKGHERFWSVDEARLDDDDPSVAYKCFGYDLKALRKCINTCDKKQGEKFMLFIGNYLPASILREIERLSSQELPNPYSAWKIE